MVCGVASTRGEGKCPSYDVTTHIRLQMAA